MLVVGEREEQASAVSVRKRNGDRENGVPLHDFIETVKGVIARKELL
jgi:threonyl-tRNA synthetase